MMSHKNVQYQPPDLSNFLLPPEEILATGCFGKLSRLRAGRVPLVHGPLESSRPPGPSIGCDVLKAHRLWPRDGLISMSNTAGCKGGGATRAAVCLLLPGAPSCSSCSSLAATPHPIHSPHIHITLCVTPRQEPAPAVIYTIIIWLHKPVPPSSSPQLGLLPAVPGEGEMDGRWLQRR